MKIALVACSKNKQTFECSAKEMYSKSVLFSKTIKFCEKQFDEIFILSAKYGVLDLQQIIQPYDETLNTFTKDQKREWVSKCLMKLKSMTTNSDSFYFFAGKNYELPLENSHFPMRGMGIGQRLNYLSK